MCTSNNTCMGNEVADELSSRLTSFDTSPLEMLVNDTADFLSNDTQRQAVVEAAHEIRKISIALNEVARENSSIASLLGV